MAKNAQENFELNNAFYVHLHEFYKIHRGTVRKHYSRLSKAFLDFNDPSRPGSFLRTPQFEAMPVSSTSFVSTVTVISSFCSNTLRPRPTMERSTRRAGFIPLQASVVRLLFSVGTTSIRWPEVQIRRASRCGRLITQARLSPMFLPTSRRSLLAVSSTSLVFRTERLTC